MPYRMYVTGTPPEGGYRRVHDPVRFSLGTTCRDGYIETCAREAYINLREFRRMFPQMTYELEFTR